MQCLHEVARSQYYDLYEIAIEHHTITISKTRSKSIQSFSQNHEKHVSGHGRFAEADFSRSHGPIPFRSRMGVLDGCIEALPKVGWPALPLSPAPKANGLRQTGERVQWPGQGDLGWDKFANGYVLDNIGGDYNRLGQCWEKGTEAQTRE